MRARAGRFRIANISPYFWRSALTRLVAFVLLLGCRSLPIADHPTCEPPTVTASEALPLDTLLQLAGKYKFVIVATSSGLDRAPVVGDLTLEAADTLQRFYQRRLSGWVRIGDRPLVGELTWHYDNGTLKTESVVVQRNAGNTELITGFCGNCADAMLVYYRITLLRAGGFAGSWQDPQTGIGRVVDSTGRELPDPKGYFCANRAL